jgi:hypothetical protein
MAFFIKNKIDMGKPDYNLRPKEAENGTTRRGKRGKK